MKKKCMSILLCGMMVAALLGGCGAEEKSTLATGDQTPVSVTDDSQTAASAENGQGADTASDQQADNTQEPSSVAADTTDDKDWSKAYDNFFDDYQLLEDNFYAEMTSEAEGVTMKLALGMADGVSVLKIYPFESNGEESSSFGFYTVGDEMYLRISDIYLDQLETGSWIKAPNDQKEESLADGMGLTEEMEVDQVQKSEYVETKELDGVLCDVLNVTTKGEDDEEESFLAYVNRATQEVIYMEKDGVKISIQNVDKIELPAEAASAEEVSNDDFAAYMIMAIFSMVDMSSMGVDMEG